METTNERLIDVLFEIRKRTVIIKCYNSINEEVYLCKGSGDDVASFLSSEILLRKIKSQKLGDNGEMIIVIDLIIK